MLASRYTIGELLGSGGFGSVYGGVRNDDGKEVSVLPHPHKTNCTLQQLLVRALDMVTFGCANNLVVLMNY